MRPNWIVLETNLNVLPTNNVSEASITVLPNHQVFEARSPVLPKSRVLEAITVVLLGYFVFGTKSLVPPRTDVFEAIMNMLPIYAVPAARTETDVLGPIRGGILAFGGECGREITVFVQYSRNRELWIQGHSKRTPVHFYSPADYDMMIDRAKL